MVGLVIARAPVRRIGLMAGADGVVGWDAEHAAPTCHTAAHSPSLRRHHNLFLPSSQMCELMQVLHEDGYLTNDAFGDARVCAATLLVAIRARPFDFSECDMASAALWSCLLTQHFGLAAREYSDGWRVDSETDAEEWQLEILWLHLHEQASKRFLSDEGDGAGESYTLVSAAAARNNKMAVWLANGLAKRGQKRRRLRVDNLRKDVRVLRRQIAEFCDLLLYEVGVDVCGGIRNLAPPRVRRFVAAASCSALVAGKRKAEGTWAQHAPRSKRVPDAGERLVIERQSWSGDVGRNGDGALPSAAAAAAECPSIGTLMRDDLEVEVASEVATEVASSCCEEGEEEVAASVTASREEDLDDADDADDADSDSDESLWDEERWESELTQHMERADAEVRSTMLTGNVAEEEEEEGAAAAEGEGGAAAREEGLRAGVRAAARATAARTAEEEDQLRRRAIAAIASFRLEKEEAYELFGMLGSRASAKVRSLIGRKTPTIEEQMAVLRPEAAAAHTTAAASTDPAAAALPDGSKEVSSTYMRQRFLEIGYTVVHGNWLAPPAQGQPQRRGGRRGPEIGSREWLEREKRRTAVRMAKEARARAREERRRERDAERAAKRQRAVNRSHEAQQRRATKEAEAAERRRQRDAARGQRFSEAVRAHAQRAAAKASAERVRRELCFLDKLASHEGGAVLVESDSARLKLKIAPPIRQPVAPGRRAVRFVLAGHRGRWPTPLTAAAPKEPKRLGTAGGGGEAGVRVRAQLLAQKVPAGHRRLEVRAVLKLSIPRRRRVAFSLAVP